ncbi:MAG: NAD-glutamate dehydrogenase, partial [Microvirga sp.]
MPAKAKAKAPERDLFDEAGALVAGAGRDVPREFVRTLFGRVPEEDLAPYTPQALADLAATAYEHLSAPRRNDGADLRLIDREVERGGGRRDITAIEVVNENMPFLLDSTLAELVEQGYEPRLVAHPILAVERDESGALARLVGEATASAPVGARRESFIQIHLDRVDDEAARGRLVEGLTKVYADVAVSVRDWPGMRTRIAEAIYSYRANPPPLPADEVSEAVAFLDWLADDNFTFLGMREYRLPKGDAAADPVEASGLGLLRDPAVKVLRRGGELLTMSPEIRAFLARPKALISTKANVKSRVHRRVHLDYIGVKLFSAEGRLQGELRIIGLFTANAYTSSLNEVPYLRHKVAKVTARGGFDPASYAGRALLNVLENYPRDELFQIDEETLYRFAIEIMNLSERPRIRALARPDEFDRFVSVLVFVPKDRYDTAVRRRIGEYLARAYKGRMSAAYPSYPEGPLARTHYIIGRDEGATPQIPQEELEAGIAAIVRTWADTLAAALAETIGGSQARALAARYAGAFSAAYREAFAAEQSIADIAILERLSDERPRAVNLYRRDGDPDTRVNLKVFSRGASLPLSERVPLLENLGFKVVNERTYRVDPPGGEDSGRIWLHDMALERAAGGALDIGAIEGPIEATILALFRGLAESDAFNKLVLEAELGWRDVAMVRAFGRYLRQIRLAFGQDYLAATLARHGAIARKIVELFYARFDPRGADQRAEAEARVRAEIEGMLQAVESLEDDRILRRFVNLVEAAVRTNFFQIDENGLPRQTIAFKFECGRVDGLPLPKPLYEIFLYSPRVEGLHLRFGKVARGGIRWSDRPQDFRTEVLGLVKAQQVKNAVIVPVGAKGGFIPKYLPSGPREAVQAEGTAAYTIFISSLLDITDNLGPDGVIPPENVVRHDGDDPYLVVAADKGTATFSDTANRISLDHGFWLGDAFASGGSAGYDHKKMGITARGAWEAVRRHFREMDIDISARPFTVAGVGDMSGDVFGNGMLLSKTIKLVAAFDHRHIFIDPNPDPAKSWDERKRMFDLPRSSWDDYNRDILSQGAMIVPRSQKSITLTEEARAALGIDVTETDPASLISAILRSPVDLLWFGGIGTYVKASTQSNADVGDTANDVLRVDASAVKARVIGEGANLAITQAARIEFSEHGGRINTDFIDNSAGVDCSDNEVNIKIPLNREMSEGRLAEPKRNALLARMTDEVSELVLEDNRLQSLALSIAEAGGAKALPGHVRTIELLEAAGRLDRKVEGLASSEDLMRRAQEGRGLTRPELAVVLSMSKITLQEAAEKLRLAEDKLIEP